MEHHDHVRLIAPGVPHQGGIWADFGAGYGAFTLALAEVAGPGTTIYAVDHDRQALESTLATAGRRFPGASVWARFADFTQPLDLPPLDGIVAANSLHYVPDTHQAGVLTRWRGYLRPEGRLILVEYDADAGNRWVPYPFSFTRLGDLARASGFGEPALLHVHPSRFLGRIYAALLVNPAAEESAEERSAAGRERTDPINGIQQR
jgi:SAM-dependent methyltransferase